MPACSARLSFASDYDIDEDRFRELLSEWLKIGRPDPAGDLLHYALYSDIVRLVGYRALLSDWPD